MQKFECQFVGGQYNGVTAPIEEVLKNYPIKGYTENLTLERAHGACVHRAELDEQPIVEGYLSPMYNGSHRDAEGNEIVHLRYETQEVYDMFAD